jgi:hypothetical protein
VVVRETFGCNSGSLFRVVQEGSGSASGIIMDDSGILGLDNLELEVDGGTCGNVDRSDID